MGGCHIVLGFEWVRTMGPTTLDYHDLYMGEIMKMGYTFACFMRKKTVFSQVIQFSTYKSIFLI
jgi:hypothetical protein